MFKYKNYFFIFPRYVILFELEICIRGKKEEGATVSVSVTTVRAHYTRRLYTMDLATTFVATHIASLSSTSRFYLNYRFLRACNRLRGTDARAPLTSGGFDRRMIVMAHNSVSTRTKPEFH